MVQSLKQESVTTKSDDHVRFSGPAVTVTRGQPLARLLRGPCYGRRECDATYGYPE